ncbi:DUF4190 domain-containing protein [Kitasatospora sp. NPDC036755]|uniref:DUF4190 domain-containing protein n=1 Tax=Kitasatospora sp. NPDC036755 TaxID=3154600 RepID=UPI0033F4F868
MSTTMSTVTGRQSAGHQSIDHQVISRRSVSHAEVEGRMAARQRAVHQAADRQSTAEADNLAVASFLLGLPGLLLFNIVLGPIAITLAVLALVRGTSRRGRALLGLTLGIASLAILAVTIATSHGVLFDLGA